MKKENFENALSEVNGSYIEEAAQLAGKKKRGTAWKVISAAAALAACFVLTVNAAVPVDLGFYLKAVFGDGYEMLSETVSMPDNLAYKYSDDSISLDMKGIVGDRQVVTVFIDLTVSADIAIPDGLRKAEEFALFDLKLRPTGMPWEKHIDSYGVTRGLIGKSKNEDGSNTFSYVLTMKSEDGVNGGKYLVSCNEMKYYNKEAKKDVTVLEGEWNLAFTLNYKDISETVQLSISDNISTSTEIYENGELIYEYGEVPAEIYKAVMSPLSLGIYWKSEYEYMDDFLGASFDDIFITMSDGSKIVKKDYYQSEEKGRFRLNNDGTWYTITEDEIAPVYITGINRGGGCDGHGEPYMGHIILTFDAPLDTENVKSVIVGGVEIAFQ